MWILDFNNVWDRQQRTTIKIDLPHSIGQHLFISYRKKIKATVVTNLELGKFTVITPVYTFGKLYLEVLSNSNRI